MRERNKKLSVGIMCWKYSHGYKILIERKRCTYSFIEFARGHYNPQNTKRIKHLFNNMTMNEKIDILSLDFGTIWRRVWLYNPDHVYTTPITYKKKAYKFNSTFVSDGGVKLRELLNNSSNVETTWEFPKGRKKTKDELDIDCAIREFKEETGINKNQYKILFDIDPVTYSHSEQYVDYINKYYVGMMKPNKNPTPKISFECKDQLSEVDALRWVTINELKVLDPTGRLAKQAQIALKQIKKRYK